MSKNKSFQRIPYNTSKSTLQSLCKVLFKPIIQKQKVFISQIFYLFNYNPVQLYACLKYSTKALQLFKISSAFSLDSLNINLHTLFSGRGLSK